MTDNEKTHRDAIVIGSGMGGMAAAAALSKVGQKVLLLEASESLGGLAARATLAAAAGAIVHGKVPDLQLHQPEHILGRTNVMALLLTNNNPPPLN